MSNSTPEVKKDIDCFMVGLKKRNPGEPEFQQAVQEVTETLMPFINENLKYKISRTTGRATTQPIGVVFDSLLNIQLGHQKLLLECLLLVV